MYDEDMIEEELSFGANFLEMKVNLKRIIKDLKSANSQSDTEKVDTLINELKNTIDYYS